MHLRNQKSPGYSAVEKHFRFKNKGSKKQKPPHQGLRLKLEEKRRMSLDNFTDWGGGGGGKGEIQILTTRKKFLILPFTLYFPSPWLAHSPPCNLPSPKEYQEVAPEF